MMWTDPKWQNYLMWLGDRGITVPRWIAREPLARDSAETKTSDVTTLKVVFISDLNLKANEAHLIEKMAAALKLNPQQWRALPAVLDVGFLQRGVPEAAVLDQLAEDLWSRLPKAQIYIAFGALATRITCGKGNFSELRGQILAERMQNVLATYHPRDLLNQITLKRQAWDDLQLTLPLIAT